MAGDERTVTENPDTNSSKFSVRMSKNAMGGVAGTPGSVVR